MNAPEPLVVLWRFGGEVDGYSVPASWRPEARVGHTSLLGPSGPHSSVFEPPGCSMMLMLEKRVRACDAPASGVEAVTTEAHERLLDLDSRRPARTNQVLTVFRPTW